MGFYKQDKIISHAVNMPKKLALLTKKILTAQKDEVQFSRENPGKEVAIKPDFIREQLPLI